MWHWPSKASDEISTELSISPSCPGSRVRDSSDIKKKKNHSMENLLFSEINLTNAVSIHTVCDLGNNGHLKIMWCEAQGIIGNQENLQLHFSEQ